MTDEEAHSAFLTHTRVKINWSVQPGVIIMIGYRLDGKTIVTCIEDEAGNLRVANPDDLELANPDDWKPSSQQISQSH